jgi:hypothetical protein
MTDAAKREIEEYLELDLDALYSLIPPFVPEHKGAVFMTQGQIEAGRTEFEKLVDNLRHVLCAEWGLCKRIKSDQYKDTIQLVSAMADTIAVHSGFVPPFLAASIIFKFGVRHFCGCPK